MITSAKYIKGISETITGIETVISGKTWIVPIDEENLDYQAILEWEKIDGNTIEEAD